MNSRSLGVGLFDPSENDLAYLKYFKDIGIEIVALYSASTEWGRKLCSDYDIKELCTNSTDFLRNNSLNIVIFYGNAANLTDTINSALGIGKHIVFNREFSFHSLYIKKILESHGNNRKQMLVVDRPFRFLPVFKIVKDLISQETFGQVNFVNCVVKCNFNKNDASRLSCFRDRDCGGGFLNRYGTQMVDLITYLLPNSVTKVFATFHTFPQFSSQQTTFPVNVTSDDCFNMSLILENNAKVFINGVSERSMSDPSIGFNIKIFTEVCSIEIIDHHVKFNILIDSIQEETGTNGLDFYNAQILTATTKIENEMKNFEILPDVLVCGIKFSVDRLQEAFEGDAIIPHFDKLKDFCSIKDGLKSKSVIEAAVESDRTRLWIDLCVSCEIIEETVELAGKASRINMYNKKKSIQAGTTLSSIMLYKKQSKKST